MKKRKSYTIPVVHVDSNGGMSIWIKGKLVPHEMKVVVALQFYRKGTMDPLMGWVITPLKVQTMEGLKRAMKMHIATLYDEYFKPLLDGKVDREDVGVRSKIFTDFNEFFLHE